MKSAHGEQLQDAVQQVACGGRHTLVLTDGGQAWSCGNNSCGQLGRHVDEDDPSANATLCIVGGFEPVPLMLVACGGAHSAALSLNGRCFTCVFPHHTCYWKSDAPPPVYPTLPSSY